MPCDNRHIICTRLRIIVIWQANGTPVMLLRIEIGWHDAIILSVMTTLSSTIQNQVPPDVIDLGLGDPSLSLLPLDLIREAAQLRLSQDDNSFLQYGVEQGDGHFRLTLADFLTKGYGFDVKSANLFVTNGISKALDLICTLFTQAGDT